MHPQRFNAGTAYLHLHGCADHDVYELVQAGRQEKLTGTNSQPSADIVATANMVCLAKEVLEGLDRGDMDKDTLNELAVYLAEESVVAKLLQTNPGLPAPIAGYEKYRILGTLAKEGLKKWAKRL